MKLLRFSRMDTALCAGGYAAGGFQVIANTPDEFAARVRKQTALAARLAKAANIKLG
jgi:hypothetical protein